MRYIVASLSLLMALAPTCLAQTRSQFGFNFSVNPASSSPNSTIGVTYHMTDRFAVRPLVRFDRKRFKEVAAVAVVSSFSFGSTQSSTQEEFDADVKQSSWAAGVGLLCYVSRSENLSTYVSGSFEYSHVKSEWTLPSLPFGMDVFSSFRNYTGSGKSVTGSFGLQYAVAKKFSVFGEVGVRYGTVDRSAATRDYSDLGSINSGLGLIFYLK